jgi:GNAT superfamily N-acetyltransferase
MPTVSDASRSDVSDIGWTLAKAFADDPVWRFLVPHDRPWQEPAARLYAAQAACRMAPDRGRVLRTEGVEGVAIWAAPGQWRESPGDLAHQATAAARLFGARMVIGLRTLAVTERAHPSEPHWYLAMLGTAPAHQGKGIGSALIAPVLRTCDEEGIPAYLESSKERNLAFYRRHGFVEREPLHAPGGGPPIWPMWREPRPPEGHA